MPWNQPGNNDNGSNQNNNGRPNRPGRGDNPPDLDEILKDAKNKFDNMFGGGGRNTGGSNNGPQFGGKAFGILLVLALVVWSFFGFYTVEEGQEGVQLRFGKYVSTQGPGLNWHIPYPIDEVIIINTNKVNTVEVGYRSRGNRNVSEPNESLMLTKDENIVDLRFAVQYDIKSGTDLVFNVTSRELFNTAESVVRQATESAVREIIGLNTMNFAITRGRQEIAVAAKVLLQNILDRYNTGINIRSVEMQNAQPPEQVQEAFNDAVRAREDQVRFINEAEAYRNRVIPLARGTAAREFEKAEAYKEQVIFKAQGEASRFEQILTEYSKAPEITRERLYIDSMQTVLSNSTKLLIDTESGNNNNLLYLPLDQMMRSRSSSSDTSQGNNKSTSTRANPNAASSNRLTEQDVREVNRTSTRNSAQ